MENRFEGAIAVLDILGFRSLMETMDIEELRDKVIGSTIEASYNAKMFAYHDMKYFDNAPKFITMNFADTIVLCLPRVEESPYNRPEVVLESMCFTCCSFMSQLMWKNIPIRGAIAYGECLVCDNPLYILGKPFLEAHKYELKQQWAGIVLTESTSSRFGNRESSFFVEYKVPIKNSRKRQSLFALNWPSFCDSSDKPNINGKVTPGLCPDWDSCFDSSNPDVVKKKKNTMKFFENYRHCTSTHQVGPDTFKVKKDWKEMYEIMKMGNGRDRFFP